MSWPYSGAWSGRSGADLDTIYVALFRALNERIALHGRIAQVRFVCNDGALREFPTESQIAGLHINNQENLSKLITGVSSLLLTNNDVAGTTGGVAWTWAPYGYSAGVLYEDFVARYGGLSYGDSALQITWAERLRLWFDDMTKLMWKPKYEGGRTNTHQFWNAPDYGRVSPGYQSGLETTYDNSIATPDFTGLSSPKCLDVVLSDGAGDPVNDFRPYAGVQELVVNSTMKNSESAGTTIAGNFLVWRDTHLDGNFTASSTISLTYSGAGTVYVLGTHGSDTVGLSGYGWAPNGSDTSVVETYSYPATCPLTYSGSGGTPWPHSAWMQLIPAAGSGSPAESERSWFVTDISSLLTDQA